MRIGYGYDSHVFEAGRELVLGGVNFPGEMGLKAHSDGDVLIHAVIDALLGAAALGDIGGHFPDTDEKWRGADSVELLKATVGLLSAHGYAIGNMDATLICERPRLSSRILEIRSRLAGAMGVDVSRISVKGKTNEKMDDVGAGRGIIAHAVVLLVESSPCG